jgi:hypothetical protein
MFPRVTHPSAAPVLLQALDLHVLSLPPAFALSQDQTLKLKSEIIWLITRYALGRSEEQPIDGVHIGSNPERPEPSCELETRFKPIHSTPTKTPSRASLRDPQGHGRPRFSFFHPNCQRARRPIHAEAQTRISPGSRQVTPHKPGSEERHTVGS